MSTIGYTEGDFATLGLILSAGLITSIVISLISLIRKDNEEEDTFWIISLMGIFNIASILLATIGGFSVIIAMFFISSIRAYNRISIFIAFFSLLTIYLIFQKFISLIKLNKYTLRLIILLFSCVLIVIAYKDLVPNREKKMKGLFEEQFYREVDFVKKIDDYLLTKNLIDAMIYQFPYVQYPESGRTVNMADYDHFRLSLQSSNTKWSYGCFRGREGDKWNLTLKEMDYPNMMKSIKSKGFVGFTVNYNGYIPDDPFIKYINDIYETPIFTDEKLNVSFYMF
jgi:phosphoglycerol transferase